MYCSKYGHEISEDELSCLYCLEKIEKIDYNGYDEEDIILGTVIKEWCNNALEVVCSEYIGTHTWATIDIPISAAEDIWLKGMRNFEVNNCEEIFVIYDTSIFCKVNKGFVISDGGMYIMDKGKSEFISWIDFATGVKLSFASHEIKILHTNGAKYSFSSNRKHNEMISDIIDYVSHTLIEKLNE